MNKQTLDAVVEGLIVGRTERKFGRITAEYDAKRKHRQDLASWSKDADAILSRQATYVARQTWVKKVLASGLVTDKAEAHQLAKIKFPL